TTGAVAVIVSHGNNGLGAISADTNAPRPAPTSADEIENTDADLDTVSRIRSNVAGAEFDDVVVWLPKFTLINRMVAAGKLP
ncbi:MAG TPA: prepilin-type cleavage/methylation domain-containing protein, partial [Burkholderiales bacterium]|nr:prepilin-type cleavage/methylation domain-containing protein [Burkholderiales bacterium]